MLIWSIFTTSILPIFFMLGVGFFLDRHFTLDLKTLGKLNFYILLPSFIFKNLYLAKFTAESFPIVLCGLLIMLMNRGVAMFFSKLLGYDPGKAQALNNISMFNNAGNIGIAVATFIFSNPPYIVNGEAPYLQEGILTIIALLIVQNIGCNTIGFYQAGIGRITPRDALSLIFHMPTVYTVPAALLLKFFAPFDLTTFNFWPALNFFANAFVGLAMITLAVQISRTPFAIFKGDVLLGIFIRLVLGPLVAFIAVYCFTLIHGPLSAIAAQAIIIVYSVPCAVNVALIAAEMKNYPEYSTQVVLGTTALSALTMPVAVLFAVYVFPF